MPKPKAPYEGDAPQRNPHADRARVHRDYEERHLEGGAPATPEAYARAAEQWQQLPGAIVSTGVPTAASDATQEESPS